MSGQVIEFPVRRAFLNVDKMRGFCDSPRSLAPEALTSKREMDLASRMSDIGLGCVRGTALALFSELVAGVTVYGIWFLWHVSR
jgi:hypothetical protein